MDGRITRVYIDGSVRTIVSIPSRLSEVLISGSIPFTDTSLVDGALLMEDGFYILLEDGSVLLFD